MPKQIKLSSLIAFLLFTVFTAQGLSAQSQRERGERIRAAMNGADYPNALTELQSMRAADPAAFALNNYDYLLARLSERLGNPAAAHTNYQRVVARNSLLSQYALWHMAELARSTGD